MYYLWLIAPVLGGVFLGYKIISRDSIDIPLSRAIYSQARKQKEIAEAQEKAKPALLAISPNELRGTTIYAVPEATVPLEDAE